MIEKIVYTLLIALLQIVEIGTCHIAYQNKKFDIFYIIYQIVIFSIFQIVLWRVL